MNLNHKWFDFVLQPTKDSTVMDVIFKNGKKFGELYKEIDGFFVFEFSNDLVGYIPSYILRSLADAIDELNKPWEETIAKNLG